MSIPESLSPRRNPFHPAACAAIVLAAILLPACRSKTQSQNRNIQALQGTPATIDARGSIVDSNVYLGSRLIEGSAGNGGSVRVTSTVGSMTVSSRPRSFDVAAMKAALTLIPGLAVGAGDRVQLKGGHIYGSLNVARGGQVDLTDSAILMVTGDVLIEGTIRTRADSSAIRRDGHDFNLQADGAVVITGSIICSGSNVENTPAANQPGTMDPRTAAHTGGNGGEIFISSGGDMALTGAVLSEGGSTDSLDSTTALAGKGGRIFIGVNGDLFFSGRVSARAGNSFTNPGTAPEGGDIQLVALGDVVMDEVTRINASGGRNSGQQAGAGGTVNIGASAGNTTIDGLEINVSGGRIFFTSGNGGLGGKVNFTGQTLTLSALDVRAGGGDVADDRQRGTTGPGGAGGEVTLSGSSSIVVASDVAFDAMGGNSLGAENAGGDGGKFFVIASGAGATNDVVTFNGSTNILGGNSFGGVEGSAGEACVSTVDNIQSLVNIVGTNHFPVGTCAASKFSDFPAIVHDLDCSDATLSVPNSTSADLPAVVGKDVYRVFVGDADSLSLTTTGVATGNVDLFAGSYLLAQDPALATDRTNYAVSSRGATSSENLSISDLGGCSGTTLASLLGPDAATKYVTVLVEEQNVFVEHYTVTVGCTQDTSTLTCGGTTTRTGSLESGNDTAVFKVVTSGSTSVTISTSGSSFGLNLYVGNSCVLGSTTPADYAVNALTSDLIKTSTHSITLDGSSSPTLASLAVAGGVLSVLVEETDPAGFTPEPTVPETFTVSITCN